jgi:hypothetical protein
MQKLLAVRFRLPIAFGVALSVAVSLIPVQVAHAGNKLREYNDRAANAARAASRTKVGNRNPVVRLTKENIKIYDRLGWEAGRYMSVRKHGSAGDPGPYPGTRRRN